MSVEQIKALSNLGARARRAPNWIDARDRSPKALGDMSGVILSRITSQSTTALQDFDYDLLDRLYVCNDMVWACINLVSSTVALGKLQVRKKSGKDFVYLPDHPLQKLLDFPNASMTQFDFIQAYVAHQMLYGKIAMLLLRPDMLNQCPLCAVQESEDCIHKLFLFNEQPIAQIMPVHPTTLKQKDVILEGQLKRYFFYTPGLINSKEYIIHPDNILTDPMYNPGLSYYGVSPTILLMRWLNLDSSMTAQITHFFNNGGIPSLLVNLKPGTNYTYEEEPSTIIEMLKEKWMERFGGGSSHQKEPAFVYGDITVERLEEKIEEMVSKNLYYEIENRVCATYGVPPSLFEFGLKYGAQRASVEQGEKDFFNRTISKYLYRLKSKINQLVVPSFNEPGLEVDWDLTDMGLASFLRDAKEERILNHWKYGIINRNDTRGLLGYEPAKDEFADDYYRITVMNDGTSNQVQGGNDSRLDNRLKVAQPKGELQE